MELFQYLYKNRINHARFAKAIDVCPGTLSTYVRRKTTPPLDKAYKIMKATKGAVTIEELVAEKDVEALMSKDWDAVQFKD